MSGLRAQFVFFFVCLCAQAVIIAGKIIGDGKNYRVFSNFKVNFDANKLQCITGEGRAAHIVHEYQQETVRALIQDRTHTTKIKSLWLGLKGKEGDKLLHWIDYPNDGIPVANWADGESGEPLPGVKETCVVIGKDARWRRVNCEESHTVFCQNKPFGEGPEVVTTIQPTTEEPTTMKPTTKETTTREPTTREPTTREPTTKAPTTKEPTTTKPTTKEPTTVKVTTREPTTKEPTTREPTTREPTTKEPTTKEPTTKKPTTREPTTKVPTTREPTTKAPTTKEPTTKEPTTKAPTTREPTTKAPTTTKPTTKKPIPQPRDMYPSCVHLAKAGLCVYYRKECPASCRIGACVDWSFNCARMALLGFCTYHESIKVMRQYCPAACGVCQQQHKGPIFGCINQYLWCQQHAINCKVIQYQKEMYAKCPQTCGVCAYAQDVRCRNGNVYCVYDYQQQFRSCSRIYQQCPVTCDTRCQRHSYCHEDQRLFNCQMKLQNPNYCKNPISLLQCPQTCRYCAGLARTRVFPPIPPFLGEIDD